jgi:hypothetical protein
LDAFGGGEVALEDGKLKMGAEVFAGFEDAAEAFFFRDVVGDDVADSHDFGV